MKLFYSSILLAGLGLSACEKRDQASAPASPAASPTNAPKGSLEGGGYLGAIARAKQHSEKTIDTVSLNKAIQDFNLQEGRNPSDLDELVSKKYLKSVPTPPYGMKIEYDAARGAVKIVSQ